MVTTDLTNLFVCSAPRLRTTISFASSLGFKITIADLELEHNYRISCRSPSPEIRTGVHRLSKRKAKFLARKVVKQKLPKIQKFFFEINVFVVFVKSVDPAPK